MEVEILDKKRTVVGDGIHFYVKIKARVNLDKTEEMVGLNYVDFYILPHLNNEYFTGVRKENIEQAIKGMTEKIYVLDDNGALKVVDGKVDIVTEGEYLEFN